MQKILDMLFELQDLEYRDFHAKLIPTIDKENMIGVRMPAMRALASRINKDKTLLSEEEKLQFMSELPHRYYEEYGIHAAFICNEKKDIDKVFEQTEEFLPYIDNWATCDCFNPKIFAKHTDRLYENIKRWVKSEKTYTVRFAVDMLMAYFLDGHFTPEVFQIVESIKTDEYYINMAIAWLMSVALVKQHDTAEEFLRNGDLSAWVRNKSIQKAVESYRITPEQKAHLKTLKV